MAVIAIDTSTSWVVAKWAVRFVLEHINVSDVSIDFGQRVTEAVEHDSGYLTLEGLPNDDRASFGAQVRRIAEDLIQNGPNSLATPSIYSGLVSEIKRLQQLVEGYEHPEGSKIF